MGSRSAPWSTSSRDTSDITSVCSASGTSCRKSPRDELSSGASARGAGTMMRLLLDSYSRKAPVFSSASLSVLAHAAIITAWVMGTLPRHDMPFDSVRREPIYLPPPDRAPSQGGSREAIRYVSLIHISEPTRQAEISYAVFCLKKKKKES